MKTKKNFPSKGERLGWKSVQEQEKISFVDTLSKSKVITRTDFSLKPLLVP